MEIQSLNNKEIEILMNGFRNENKQFIIEIYKYLRNIAENKLKKNLVIYDKSDFKKLGWEDKAIDRLVARY